MGNLMLASVAGLFFSGLFYLISLFLFILSRLNFISFGKLFGYVINLSFYFAIAFAVLFMFDLATYGKKKARREHYISNDTRLFQKSLLLTIIQKTGLQSWQQKQGLTLLFWKRARVTIVPVCVF